MRLIIDIKVQDLQRAITFYTSSLGLVLRIEEKEWAALLVGDAEIHLYVGGGATKDVEFYVEDINAETQKMIGQGVKFQSGLHKPHAISVDENNITTFPWGRTAFFQDSEGNELAIVEDSIN
jgi:predicted enzyme related to lactoylglutathione lyase